MTLERKDGDWLLTLTWTGNDIRTILEHHGLELEDSQIMEIMEFLDKMSSLGVSTERIEDAARLLFPDVDEDEATEWETEDEY